MIRACQIPEHRVSFAMPSAYLGLFQKKKATVNDAKVICFVGSLSLLVSLYGRLGPLRLETCLDRYPNIYSATFDLLKGDSHETLV